MPFQTDGSGLKYLKKGTFGGNADALGIDVNGKIGKLTFKKGLGDPTGVNTLDPPGHRGGRLAGHPVRNSSGVDRLSAPAVTWAPRSRPSTFTRSRSSRPTCRSRRRRTRLFVQPQNQGIPLYIPSPGFALSNVIVATSGSIDNVDILGIQHQSEIKTGFDFSSYVAGLEGTRAASAINDLNANGDHDQQRDLGDAIGQLATLTPMARETLGRARSPGSSAARHTSPARTERRASAIPARACSPGTSQ